MIPSIDGVQEPGCPPTKHPWLLLDGVGDSLQPLNLLGQCVEDDNEMRREKIMAVRALSRNSGGNRIPITRGWARSPCRAVNYVS
jgi:hypothetical protein